MNGGAALAAEFAALANSHNAAWHSASSARMTFGDLVLHGGSIDPSANRWQIRQDAEAPERLCQAELLREIFGNPFRSITIDPRWQTSTVVDLARSIYEGRAFDKMPILANALMDAGCDSEEIINYCRQAGEHVRGCWVVDLLTARE